MRMTSAETSMVSKLVELVHDLPLIKHRVSLCRQRQPYLAVISTYDPLGA